MRAAWGKTFFFFFFLLSARAKYISKAPFLTTDATAVSHSVFFKPAVPSNRMSFCLLTESHSGKRTADSAVLRKPCGTTAVTRRPRPASYPQHLVRPPCLTRALSRKYQAGVVMSSRLSRHTSEPRKGHTQPCSAKGGIAARNLLRGGFFFTRGCCL